MNQEAEPQPPNQTELRPLSPEVRQVYDTVSKVAIMSESRPNDSNVVKYGNRRQKRGARFIFAQITSPTGLSQGGLAEPDSDQTVELYACDSLGNKIQPGDHRPDEINQVSRGSVQVIKIQAGRVTGVIDGQSFSFDATSAGQTASSEFIRAFYRDNFLDEIPGLEVTFGET